jgi:hypothetical protein
LKDNSRGAAKGAKEERDLTRRYEDTKEEPVRRKARCERHEGRFALLVSHLIRIFVSSCETAFSGCAWVGGVPMFFNRLLKKWRGS